MLNRITKTIARSRPMLAVIAACAIYLLAGSYLCGSSSAKTFLPTELAAGQVRDISGKWSSNIGVDYEITQSGNQFTWFAAKINQKGSGTLSQSGISASWTDPGGSGSAKGNITEVDSSGAATRIEWDNGVVFFRKTGSASSPTAPTPPIVQTDPTAKVAPPGSIGPAVPKGVIDISGKWTSTTGQVYEITQNGEQFIWYVAAINEKGSGTLKGQNITASWTGNTGSGSAQGGVGIDPNGKANRIEWENGVVLSRISLATPAGGSAATPIPIPMPEAGKLGQFPTPSAAVLNQVTTPPTRTTMLDSLLGNPATKASLESAAASAGRQLAQLKTESLDGTPVGNTVPSAFGAGKTLSEIWSAPVHFSPTKPGPMYQQGQTGYAAGNTNAGGIFMTTKNSLNLMLQKDVLLLGNEGQVYLYAELPPGGGQYLIAVQASSLWSSISEYFPVNLVALVTYVNTAGKEEYVKLTLAPTTDKSGLVGLCTIKPFRDEGPGPAEIVFGMRAVSMRLTLQFNNPVVFGGVTVSRL